MKKKKQVKVKELNDQIEKSKKMLNSSLYVASFL